MPMDTALLCTLLPDRYRKAAAEVRLAAALWLPPELVQVHVTPHINHVCIDLLDPAKLWDHVHRDTAFNLGICVAGSAALWSHLAAVNGEAPCWKYNDIDVFVFTNARFCLDDFVMQWVKLAGECVGRRTGLQWKDKLPHSKHLPNCPRAIYFKQGTRATVRIPALRLKVQVIDTRMTVMAPTEWRSMRDVVASFDIDVCRFAFNGVAAAKLVSGPVGTQATQARPSERQVNMLHWDFPSNYYMNMSLIRANKYKERGFDVIKSSTSDPHWHTITAAMRAVYHGQYLEEKGVWV